MHRYLILALPLFVLALSSAHAGPKTIPLENSDIKVHPENPTEDWKTPWTIWREAWKDPTCSSVSSDDLDYIDRCFKSGACYWRPFSETVAVLCEKKEELK